MWEHQVIMQEIHRAKTVNLSNPWINFIYHLGIVSHHRRHHFQALPSSTTWPHSTWHQAHNQAQLQPNDIRVMGSHGKEMISPKEVLVHLKCSSLSNSQDRGHHLQAHLECLQHCLHTIQSFGPYHPTQVVTDNLPTHLGDPRLASQWNDSSQLWNRPG